MLFSYAFHGGCNIGWKIPKYPRFVFLVAGTVRKGLIRRSNILRDVRMVSVEHAAGLTAVLVRYSGRWCGASRIDSTPTSTPAPRARASSAGYSVWGDQKCLPGGTTAA